MEDAKVMHECNNNDLCNQAETTQQKEELLRNKDLTKAMPEYKEALDHHTMYYMDICWSLRDSDVMDFTLE